MEKKAEGTAAGSLQDMWRELRWMWRYVRRYRGSVAVYLLVGIISVSMGLGGSVASKYLIDAVTGFKTASIARAAVAMGGMLLLGIAVRAVYKRLSARILVKVRNEMRAELFERILHADWEGMQQFRSGDLLNRVNVDAQRVASASVTMLPGFLIACIQFCGALGVLLYYDPVMALIVLVSVPLSVVFSKLLVRRMRQYNRELRRLDSDILSYNEDAFRNLQTVKAFDAEGQFADRMQGLQSDAYETYLQYNRFSVLTSALLSLIGLLVYAGCFGWGVYRLWGGAITYGTMTLFLQMSNTVSGAFSSMVSTVPTAIEATTSAGRMMEIAALPLQREAFGEEDGRCFSLHLEDVSFAYCGGETVLRDVSLAVHPGEMIAVVGPSGEGKTTLVRLMLDLVAPTKGRVRLTDDATGEEAPVSVRRVCAYVPQGNTLFAGTLAENLRLTRPDATDEQLIAALKDADAWEFVQKLPEGLDTPVGEHGAGFSEGQAQRLAIARALLRDAPILFLDEATSALDEQTEQRVLRHLAASDKPRVTVVITHRPGVLPLCDRVYRIDATRLTELPRDD